MTKALTELSTTLKSSTAEIHKSSMLHNTHTHYQSLSQLTHHVSHLATQSIQTAFQSMQSNTDRKLDKLIDIMSNHFGPQQSLPPAGFPSPGSSNTTPTSPGAKLLNQLRLFQSREVDIYINRKNTYKVLEDKKCFKALQNINEVSYTRIRDKLSIPDGVSSSDRLFFAEKLQSQKENSYQKIISQLCSNDTCNTFKLMDSHSQSEGLSEMSCQEEAFKLTSKPDLISTALPMLLECKSEIRVNKERLITTDIDAIHQGLDRIWTHLTFSAALSKIVVFVTTGYFSWCLVFLREIRIFDQSISESLDIVSISPEQLDFLWQDITAMAVKYGKKYYLTPDGPMLYRSLKELGLPCTHCRINYSAGRKSKVYTITLTDKNLEVSSVNPTWAIKIVRDDSNFFRESKTLEKINSQWDHTGTNKTFYALGALDCKLTPNRSWMSERLLVNVTQVMKTISKKKRKFADMMADGCWWSTLSEVIGEECEGEEECKGEGGGAIFMKVGQRTLNQTYSNPQQILSIVGDEIFTSLQAIHASNILHCDIRPCNIMKFDDGWQIIDFDLSCKKGKKIKLIPDTGQFKYCPEDAKALSVGEKVVWSKQYDNRMLLKCFLEKSFFT
eukprot:gene7731-15809_t